MKILGRLPVIRRFTQEDNESGVVVVLTAFSLIILMGMAAFAVDLGWLYYSQLNVRKAAEASALAGVVHMPLPGCADPLSGTEPYVVALELATTHDYNNGANAAVTPSTGANCNQLTVNITSTVPTFFMKAFGRNSFVISESATAEQLPPLKIGSDESYLGEDPGDSSRLRQFYLAISGLDRRKGSGDAYAALFLDGGTTANPERLPRPDDASLPYYYAVEVVPGSAAEFGDVDIQVYDGVTHNTSGSSSIFPNDGPAHDWQYDSGRDPGSDNVTRFRVFAPDATPADWLDNTNVLCTTSYHSLGNGSYEAAAENAWTSACAVNNAAAGIYVVEVSVSGFTNVINGFSLRTVVSGTNDTQVYGLGAMSLWQTENGANPSFKVARLDSVYAGSELVISLWDISDIGAGSNVTINFDNPILSAPINTLDCTKQTRNDSGLAPSGYIADDGGANCRETFAKNDYNNRWLDLKFDVPADYSCSGDECWIYVSYTVPAGITDRTTWTASVNGQPIHLVQ